MTGTFRTLLFTLVAIIRRGLFGLFGTLTEIPEYETGVSFDDTVTNDFPHTTWIPFQCPESFYQLVRHQITATIDTTVSYELWIRPFVPTDVVSECFLVTPRTRNMLVVIIRIEACYSYCSSHCFLQSIRASTGIVSKENYFFLPQSSLTIIHNHTSIQCQITYFPLTFALGSLAWNYWSYRQLVGLLGRGSALS